MSSCCCTGQARCTGRCYPGRLGVLGGVTRAVLYPAGGTRAVLYPAGGTRAGIPRVEEEGVIAC